MEKKQKNWLGKGIVIACIAAAVFSYLFIPSVKALCGQIAAMFATGISPSSGSLWLPTGAMRPPFPLH